LCKIVSERSARVIVCLIHVRKVLDRNVGHQFCMIDLLLLDSLFHPDKWQDINIRPRPLFHILLTSLFTRIVLSTVLSC
jgi:hypothetical protein